MRNPPSEQKQPDTGPLKRAIGDTMRAIAADPELEVLFSSDRPSLSGHTARLPEPSRRPVMGFKCDHEGKALKFVPMGFGRTSHSSAKILDLIHNIWAVCRQKICANRNGSIPRRLSRF